MGTDTGSVDSGSTRLTQVPSSSTAHTKNTTYTELIASTSADTEWLRVGVSGDNGTVTSEYFIDIATGAVSSESVKVANINFNTKANIPSDSFPIPISIASGARVSATCQSADSSATNVGVYVEVLTDDTWGTNAAIETIGVNTGTTVGTAVDPGATPDTLGSWVEISSSISHDYDYYVVQLDIQRNSASSTAHFLIEIGTGTAASEVTQNILHTISLTNETLSQYHFPITGSTISSGTRIAARAQSSISDAQDRVLGVSIIGVNMDAPAGGGSTKAVKQGIQSISSGICA